MIASLASLISYKAYSRYPVADKKCIFEDFFHSKHSALGDIAGVCSMDIDLAEDCFNQRGVIKYGQSYS